MKRLACIVLLALGSASLLCSRMDPIPKKRWRSAVPRLAGAQWGECCRRDRRISTCDGTLNRAKALELLPNAERECLDKVFQVIEEQAPEELSAAYYIRAERKGDPVDYLRALDAAKTPFNRALAHEQLGLKAEAIRSWDEVVKAKEAGWAAEATAHRDRLLEPDPAEAWSIGALEAALRDRDAAAVEQLVSAFPLNTMRYFEESDLLNIERARMFAQAFTDPYPRDIVAAVERGTDRKTLEEGLRAFREARALEYGGYHERAAELYERAATLLERVGNPLHLGARYGLAKTRGVPLPVLDTMAATAEKRGYRDIARRVHTLRGVELDFESRYLDAQTAYARALAYIEDDPATTVTALARRSMSYATLGNAEAAFGDFFRAKQDLPRAADLNAVHNAYGAAAAATRKLGYPEIALQYQHLAVDVSRRALERAPSTAQRKPKNHLSIALRERANIYVALGDDARAKEDLEQASELAKAVDLPSQTLLRMRLLQVDGRLLAKRDPMMAAERLTEAIKLAAGQDSTFRAVLHEERALARRNAGDPDAEADTAQALQIIREEATRLLDRNQRGDFEELWSPYFARFQSLYEEMIQRLVDRGEKEAAFIYAEAARAFEPMHLLLRATPIPQRFRKVDSVDDLRRARATLPKNTVILQYLVLDDKTYTWAISSDRFDLFVHGAGRRAIERWIDAFQKAVKADDEEADGMFRTPARAAFRELFAEPIAHFTHPHVVVVPDRPMHGLPFAALVTPDGKYFIERASIAVAGSTSLYLYALARDSELSTMNPPKVFIVGNPTIPRHLELPPLRLRPLSHALGEAQQLARDYPGAELLLGDEATTRNFLDGARDATIIHFAGHALSNPHDPWTSMLVLAPDQNDAGDLTAEKLLKELPDLGRTRFVALSACSSASGDAVGPEGLAPLVRPLIAARVPAVLGTLWDVGDDTAKQLLVSLHCHYRNGDDVAVALRNAQLDMLRRNVPARLWAPFQVVGYAGSPYERPAANGGTSSERVCAENSLYRPDGLHPQ